MANSLSLTIGANTVTIPVKGSVAQVNAAILRFAMVKGIPTNGRTANEIGTDVLTSLLRYVRDTSVDRQRVELLQANAAAQEAQILADNDL